MKKPGYKIISRLLVIILTVLFIPASISWAKYSWTIDAGEIEFTLSPSTEQKKQTEQENHSEDNTEQEDQSNGDTSQKDQSNGNNITSEGSSE